MELRTDLALEVRQMHPECPGVECTEHREGDATVATMTITEQAVRTMGRAAGRYVTVSLPALTDHAFVPGEQYECISRQLTGMLPEKGTVLVAGLGNMSITPDALGPKTAAMIPATRHLRGADRQEQRRPNENYDL